MNGHIAFNLQIGKQMALRKDLIKGVYPRDGQDYWVVDTQDANYKISEEEARRIIPMLTAPLSLELSITEQVTLMTLLHAHLNADQPERAREMIANDIADFAEGKNRERFANMGLQSVLKEYGATRRDE